MKSKQEHNVVGMSTTMVWYEHAQSIILSYATIHTYKYARLDATSYVITTKYLSTTATYLLPSIT